MFAAISTEAALGILLGVSFIYLLLVLVVSWTKRPLEHKLITLGLLTGLLAVWCGMLTGAAETSLNQGQGGAAFSVRLGSDAPATLGRLALILVLGGIAVHVPGRWNVPPVIPSREETPHDRPVL